MTEREASVRSTLKLALEALETLTEGHSLGGKKLGVEAITAVKEALEQPEQEPVGEVLNEKGEVDWISFVPPIGASLYTTPQPAVPERNPLSDEQIMDIVREAAKGSAIRRDGATSHRIARAIEAAHGIKE